LSITQYRVPDAIEEGTAPSAPLLFATEIVMKPAVDEALAPTMLKPDDVVVACCTITTSPSPAPATAHANGAAVVAVIGALPEIVQLPERMSPITVPFVPTLRVPCDTRFAAVQVAEVEPLRSLELMEDPAKNPPMKIAITNAIVPMFLVIS